MVQKREDDITGIASGAIRNVLRACSKHPDANPKIQPKEGATKPVCRGGVPTEAPITIEDIEIFEQRQKEMQHRK